jgi:hypothetical protein
MDLEVIEMKVNECAMPLKSVSLLPDVKLFFKRREGAGKKRKKLNLLNKRASSVQPARLTRK